MTTALIINLIFAAIAIAFFLHFLSGRKNAQIHMQHYEEQLADEIEKRKESEVKYQAQIQSLKTNATQTNATAQLSGSEESKSAVDSLVAEVANLRKEKDQELQSRLEAEKQIALALQKTNDIQVRIDDWKTIQEANLKDANDMIVKVGNDLYGRLIADYHAESELIRNKVDDTIKNVHEYLERIVKQVQFLNVHNVDTNKAVNAAISINNDEVNINHSSRNLEDVLRSAHLQPDIDYFMHHNLPEEVRKSVLCETMIIINPENIIAVDIKSARFFLELFAGRARDDETAENEFPQKMDRYLAYLANKKYRSNIISYFSRQQIISPDANISLIMLVPTQKEVEAFEELGDEYIQILADNNINLHSLKSLSNLIFGE
jgi:hypothetical protein